jgi:hypothetical protein
MFFVSERTQGITRKQEIIDAFFSGLLWKDPDPDMYPTLFFSGYQDDKANFYSIMMIT